MIQVSGFSNNRSSLPRTNMLEGYIEMIG